MGIMLNCNSLTGILLQGLLSAISWILIDLQQQHFISRQPIYRIPPPCQNYLACSAVDSKFCILWILYCSTLFCKIPKYRIHFPSTVKYSYVRNSHFVSFWSFCIARFLMNGIRHCKRKRKTYCTKSLWNANPAVWEILTFYNCLYSPGQPIVPFR